MPGFVDVHCHGRNNFDFCDALVDGVNTIAREKLAEGVTTLLPTTLTLPEADLAATLKSVAAYDGRGCQTSRRPPRRPLYQSEMHRGAESGLRAQTGCRGGETPECDLSGAEGFLRSRGGGRRPALRGASQPRNHSFLRTQRRQLQPVQGGLRERASQPVALLQPDDAAASPGYRAGRRRSAERRSFHRIHLRQAAHLAGYDCAGVQGEGCGPHPADFRRDARLGNAERRIYARRACR